MPDKCKACGHDPEELRFTRQERELRESPATWIPALLVALVEAAEEKEVFVEGGLVRLVEKTIVEVAKKEVCSHCAGEGVLYPELADGSEPSYPCPHCQHEE